MALNITVLTVITFLVPMFYLLMVAPTFLLVRLDIPQVARLLWAMFFGYFAVLVGVGVIATVLNLLDGRSLPARVIGSVTTGAILWRGWMMRRLDLAVAENLAGQSGTAQRLRRLHVMGMVVNAVQSSVMVVLIPYLVVVA